MTHTIALDIDGVVFNPQLELIASANKLFDTNYTIEDVTRFDYNNFPRRVKQHFLKCWDTFDYNTIAPVEGFYESYAQLKHLGRVIVVTAPMPGSLHLTSKWSKLTRLFGEKNIVFTHSKELVAADILIDDGPKYIDQWLSKDKPIVILEQPWNKEHIQGLLCTMCKADTPWTSVPTFADIPKAVEELLIW